MKGKLILVCLLLMAVALVASVVIASARPMSPGFFVRTQADGSKITVSMLGSDECITIGQTADGYTVLPDAKGVFVYATLDKKGELVATNVKANDPGKRGAAEKAFVAKLAKGLNFTAAQKGKNTPPQPQNQWEMNTLTGNATICCLLAEFKDYAWTASTQTMSNMLNQHGYQSPISGQTGSYHEYMEAQSGGLLNITVDVKGPFKVTAHGRKWYLGDGGGMDRNTPVLFDDLLVKADPTVNFAVYDNDNNGTVDPIIMIAAGPDQWFSNDPNDIGDMTFTLASAWPWGLPPRTVDGKQAYELCSMGEWRYVKGDRITPLATVTHEYGHCMGLTDTYGWAGGGPGCYDQMGYGCWAGGEGDKPSSYMAWHKIFWGWITPTVLNSPATNVTIANRSDNPLVGYKIVNATSGQDWVLENVKVTGWDAFCQNSGLLITHWASGAIEPADGVVACSAVSQQGDVWPGTSNNTSFTDTTTPNMKDTLGNNTGKPMTNISYDGSYVSHFDFMQ